MFNARISGKQKRGRAIVSRLKLMTWLFFLTASDLSMAETISINFRDADIRSAIESVAEVTGLSFVLDPRVKGKLSIIAPEPIEREFFYEVFRSSLQVHGYHAVEDGDVIRIVPFAQAFDLVAGPAGNEIETQVLKVQNVKAVDILPSLQPMVSKGAQIHATETSNHLVVTDTRSKIERIQLIVKKLDTPDQSDMEVISMQHLSTGEALHIINQMNLLDEQKISIVEDQLNNRIIISGPPLERNKFRKLLAVLDVPTNSQPGVQVVYLNHADAEEMKVLLTSMLESSIFQYGVATSVTEEKKPQYKIEADIGNNALVIAAPEVVTDKLNVIIRKLDRPRDQVLIEAIVAEISEDKAREFSVQLSALGGSGGYLTNFDTILGVLAGISDPDDTVENVATALSSSTGLVGAVGDLDGSSSGFFGLISALQSDADTNILSTPSVVTLDNEEATLSVGQEVPFITGSFQTDSSSDATNPFQTIEREEVGIKLIVTPQINEGDRVKLAIEQESSNLLASAEALGTADVVTASRKIKTNVLVGDGELLVLGGLIGQDFTRTESKVPILGSIPVLGRLFKSKSRSTGTSVLMIFIRPTVIRNDDVANRVTEDRYRYIRQRQLSWDDNGLIEPPSLVKDLDKALGLEKQPELEKSLEKAVTD